MMRIACILPMSPSPFRHHGNKDYIQMSGLLSVAHYLKQQGHDVAVFDYLKDEGQTKQFLDRRLEEFSPSLLVICTMFCLEDAVETLSGPTASRSGICSVCFGTGVLDYRKTLERLKQLDYVVPADPEVVVAKLAHALESGEPVENVPGVATRNSRGNVGYAGTTHASLDVICRKQNLESAISRESESSAYLWASRGCWYKQCTFCTVGAASNLCKGTGWVKRDIDAVITDIEILYEKGIKHIHFLDAEFIGPGNDGRKRAHSFADKLIATGMDIRFFIDARVDSLEEETLTKLKQAGLSTVFVGIESLSNTMLERLKKGYRVEDVKQTMKTVRRLKIPFRIGWLLADPGAALEEVKESIEGLPGLRLFDGLRVYNIDTSTGVNSIYHELHLHSGTPIYNETGARDNKGTPMGGEVYCHYKDPRIAAVLEETRSLRNEIGRRYRWLKSVKELELEENGDAWRDKQWQNRYEYALGLLSYNGLHTRVNEYINAGNAPVNKADARKQLDNMVEKYDRFWFGEDFETFEKKTNKKTGK